MGWMKPADLHPCLLPELWPELLPELLPQLFPMRRLASRLQTAALLLTLTWLALGSQAVQAQYKWVGRDGVVHYSDLPPPAGARLLPRGGQSAPSAEVPRSTPPPINSSRQAATPALPAALADTVNKAPVVLYTTAGCSPCDEGRSLLRSRGVPVRERRIETEEDLKALQVLGIATTGFPVLTVGTERAIGFEQGQWQRMLDAAQYPAASMLPRGWQPEPASQLSKASGPPSSGPPSDRETPNTASESSSGATSTPSQSGSSRIRF